MSLSPEVMRNIILVASFRGDDLHRAQAALLLIGLQGVDFNAGELPGELCTKPDGTPDAHIAGMACASLAAQNLIVGIGRVRSSSPLANGRKVNLWRIPSDRVATARTWLARHGYSDKFPAQAELALS